MKEMDIQKAICDYLALKKYFFWRQNNVPVYNSKLKRFRAMPKYSMNGIPDIFLLPEGGKIVFLEVKTPKGVQSANQKEFQKSVEELGYTYHIVKSVDDVIDLGY